MSWNRVSFSEIGQQLALAEHPPGGCEVAGEHPDLAYIWLCHVRCLLVRRRGRCPAGRCRTSGSGTAACSGAPGYRRRVVIVPGLIAVSDAGVWYTLLALPRNRSAGLSVPPLDAVEAATMCVCVGISAIDSVWACAPDALSERVAAPLVDRHPAAQIRQGEVHPSVTTERGAQQREQRLVLVDRQAAARCRAPSPWARRRTTSSGSLRGTARPSGVSLATQGHVDPDPVNVPGALAAAVPCAPLPILPAAIRGESDAVRRAPGVARLADRGVLAGHESEVLVRRVAGAGDRVGAEVHARREGVAGRHAAVDADALEERDRGVGARVAGGVAREVDVELAARRRRRRRRRTGTRSSCTGGRCYWSR